MRNRRIVCLLASLVLFLLPFYGHGAVEEQTPPPSPLVSPDSGTGTGSQELPVNKTVPEVGNKTAPEVVKKPEHGLTAPQDAIKTPNTPPTNTPPTNATPVVTPPAITPPSKVAPTNTGTPANAVSTNLPKQAADLMTVTFDKAKLIDILWLIAALFLLLLIAGCFVLIIRNKINKENSELVNQFKHVNHEAHHNITSIADKKFMHRDYEKEMRIKLDLAKQYLDVGDTQTAIALLQEVASHGNDRDKESAQEILLELSHKN